MILILQIYKQKERDSETRLMNKWNSGWKQGKEKAFRKHHPKQKFTQKPQNGSTDHEKFTIYTNYIIIYGHSEISTSWFVQRVPDQLIG